MPVDITPSPRILIILGTVEIDPWQCIAELVDNAIDGYLNAPEKWKKKYGSEMKVEIHLPTAEELSQGIGEVIVKDTGPGMTRDQLNNAVRAGWSGNEGYDRLGLFGMGFNVATAKLGNRTRISTAKAEDSDRYWINIDPHAMHEHWRKNPSDAWDAPDGIEVKESKLVDQGTKVVISQLKEEKVRELLVGGNSRLNLRKRLGRIYSPLMKDHNIDIRIFKKASRRTNGLPIAKWEHCIWSSERTVPSKGKRRKEYISAYQDVLEILPSQHYCSNCWKWFQIGEKVNICPEEEGGCGSKDIKKRKRVITGWIGVQKAFFGRPHTPQDHYGIDLVRNGRVIRELSKDFFSVEEMDGTIRVDYPVEGRYWGRIVGSLDISFCPTDFRKRGFEKADQNWSDVLKNIQGNGLRPQKTADDGSEFIETTLSKMVSAFGSDKLDKSKQPGMNTLIAGKVKMAKGKPVLTAGLPTLQGDFSKHRDFVNRFWQNDPEYQSDEKWWEDIEWAEEFDPHDWYEKWKSENEESGGGGTGRKCTHDNDPKKCTECKSGMCKHRVKEKDCVFCNPTKIKDSWTIDENMSNIYSIDLNGVNYDYAIDVYCDEGKIKPKSVPLELITKKRGEYIAVYQKMHPMFSSYKESPFDYLMMHIAWIASKANAKLDYPETYVYLKEVYCEDQKVDFANVKVTADRLIVALKEYVIEWELEGSDLSEELIGYVKSRAASVDHKGEDAAGEELKDGTFVQRLSGRLLFDEILVRRVTELLDGNFFNSEIKKISNASRRRNIVREYETYLSLVCNVAEIENPDYDSLMAVQSAVIWLENRRV